MFLHAMKRRENEFALIAHDGDGVSRRQRFFEFGQSHFDVVNDIDRILARLAANVQQ